MDKKSKEKERVMASYRAISKKLAELFLPVDSSNEE